MCSTYFEAIKICKSLWNWRGRRKCFEKGEVKHFPCNMFVAFLPFFSFSFSLSDLLWMKSNWEWTWRQWQDFFFSLRRQRVGHVRKEDEKQTEKVENGNAGGQKWPIRIFFTSRKCLKKASNLLWLSLTNGWPPFHSTVSFRSSFFSPPLFLNLYFYFNIKWISFKEFLFSLSISSEQCFFLYFLLLK